MADPVWFPGVCDLLLLKIKAWHEGYSAGEVHSTRDYLNHQGVIVPAITKRLHTIAFSEQEVTYFRNIMKCYCPNKSLVEEIIECTNGWKNKPLALNKQRRFRLAFYPEHVQQMYEMIIKAKREHLMGKSVDTMIAEAKDKGKDLFEI